NVADSFVNLVATAQQETATMPYHRITMQVRPIGEVSHLDYVDGAKPVPFTWAYVEMRGLEGSFRYSAGADKDGAEAAGDDERADREGERAADRFGKRVLVEVKSSSEMQEIALRKQE